METVEVVWTQDLSSGRVHKRYRTATGELATIEGCNADQAGDFRVVQPIEVAHLPLEAFCQNDFPTQDIADRINGEP